MPETKAFKRVAVLCGGWSSERDISLESGEAVLKGLQQAGVNAFKLDLQDAKQAIDALRDTEMDCAFITLHGKGGEDGVVQSILECLDVPYTGSDHLASAVAMDKLVSKQLWLNKRLPTPAFEPLYEGFDSEYVVEVLGLPLAVKPVSEGSSIGVTRVSKSGQLTEAWKQAMKCGGKVFAEKWIDGAEYSVAFVGDRIFPPVLLKPRREFYDYEAKYKSGGTQYICPADLSLYDVSKVQALVWQAAAALRIKGWGRVDLRRDNDGKFWLLEANTVPGMTDHSLVPMSASADDIDFSELTTRILATVNGAGEYDR